MYSQERWRFDVDLGQRMPVCAIDELLQMAEEEIASKNYDCAERLLDRATASNSGRLKYSEFLMAHLPRSRQHLAKIENLLTYVERHGTPAEAKSACAMLAEFYSRYKNKPLRSLGYALRARRLGHEEIDCFAKNLHKKLIGLEIAQLEDIPGAYICGVECAEEVSLQHWACRFLAVVAESGVVPWAGLAAMRMAEILERNSPQDPAIQYWMRLASDYGNPEILKKQNMEV